MFVSVNDFGCGGCNKAGLPYKDDKPESNADTAFEANSFTRAIVSMQRRKQTPAKFLQGFVFAGVCQCSDRTDVRFIFYLFDSINVLQSSQVQSKKAFL